MSCFPRSRHPTATGGRRGELASLAATIRIRLEFAHTVKVARLEIRDFRRRQLDILFRAIFVWIFAADIFRTLVKPSRAARALPAVGPGRGPRRGETVRIIDGEQKLKPLAAVIEIHDRRII